MIILFHLKCIFISYLFNLRKSSSGKQEHIHEVTEKHERKENEELKVNRVSIAAEEEMEASSDLRFIPPVYLQRYVTVQDILLDQTWMGEIKKVVDFGCAEFGFFPFIKRITGVEEFFTVDIDKSLLERHSCRVAPLTTDYLSHRETPLQVHIFAGSIANCDYRLVGLDAVVCIEIIEHLWPDELNAVPYTVFGFIKPRVAIFTTPNADFNILFPNFAGFRHFDHKFEWSREQFQSWADNIIVQYPDYDVSFHGIGSGPLGTESVGHCSQMAVFTRCHISNPSEPQIFTESYELVTSYIYPFRVDPRNEEEKISHEAEYALHSFSGKDEFFGKDGIIAIPIKLILPFVEKWTCSLEMLERILRRNGWEFSAGHEDDPTLIYPYFYDDHVDEDTDGDMVETSSHCYQQQETEEVEDWTSDMSSEQT